MLLLLSFSCHFNVSMFPLLSLTTTSLIKTFERYKSDHLDLDDRFMLWFFMSLPFIFVFSAVFLIFLKQKISSMWMKNKKLVSETKHQSANDISRCFTYTSSSLQLFMSARVEWKCQLWIQTFFFFFWSTHTIKKKTRCQI